MSTVFTEDRGAVRHVVLNRPEKRNAMNYELLCELGETLRTAAADNDVHCVVLRGEGPVFSAGVDVGEFPASTAPDARRRSTAESSPGSRACCPTAAASTCRRWCSGAT
jgi:enoyl-CoA hydratase/carnithine racemase